MITTIIIKQWKQKMRYSSAHTPTIWAITFVLGCKNHTFPIPVWKPKQLYWLVSVLLRAPRGASVQQRESVCRQNCLPGTWSSQMYRIHHRYRFCRHSKCCWTLAWRSPPPPPLIANPSPWFMLPCFGRVQTATQNTIFKSTLKPDCSFVSRDPIFCNMDWTHSDRCVSVWSDSRQMQ